MSFQTLQTLHAHVSVLAAGGGTGGINQAGINTLMVQVLAPILLGLVGLGLIAKSHKGQVSKAANTGTVAIIGVIFLVGAASLMVFGGKLATTVLG